MKKYICWSVFVVLLVPVLIEFGVRIINFSFLAGDDNTWISFWGSYISSIITVALSARISYVVTRNENNRTASIAKKQAVEELRLKESHEAMQSTVKKVNSIYRDTYLINKNSINILRNLIETTSEIDFESPNNIYKQLYQQASMLVRNVEVEWHYDEDRANVDLRYAYMDNVIFDLDFVKDYLALQVLDNEELRSDLEELIKDYVKLSDLVTLLFKILNIHHLLFDDTKYGRRDESIRENMNCIKDTINDLKKLNSFFCYQGVDNDRIQTHTKKIQEKYEDLFSE
ncbi:hypothetical protein GTP11_08910 [Lactiplantibacillus plantarum]|uniref:hypothetical protein n=1 Tax=Lactiplantibacillus plantarum TaxID=1590 RepID=UPI0010725438|nr:hypothetical protein [Lactiplantibacillus plantarum]MBO2713186.1 hypothetical protein [Lactiplantibacillus plantarum]